MRAFKEFVAGVILGLGLTCGRRFIDRFTYRLRCSFFFG